MADGLWQQGVTLYRADLSAELAVADIRRPGTIADATALDPAVALPGGGVAIQRQNPTFIEILLANGRLSAKLPPSGSGLILAQRGPMALLGGDTLVVLDVRGRRLALYRLRQEAPFLVGTRSLEHSYTDACAVGDALLLFRPANGGAVDVLRSNMQRPQVLVEQVGEVRPAIERTLMDARLVCGGKRPGFGVVMIHAPEIRWYDLQGTVLWRKQVQGYRHIVVLRPSPGSFGLSTPAGGYHKLQRSVLAADTLLIVQLALVDSVAVPWGARRPIESFAYNINGGSEVQVRGLTAELVATRGPYVWALAGAGMRLTRHRLVLREYAR